MITRNLVIVLLTVLAVPRIGAAQDEGLLDVMMTLGSHEAFEVGDEGCYLVAASGDRRRVVSVDRKKGTAVLDSVKGRFTVSIDALDRMDREDLDALSKIIDAAPKFSDVSVRLGEDALLGLNLTVGDTVVTTSGRLRALETREIPASRIGAESAAVLKELKTTVDDEAVRRAVAEILAALEKTERNPSEGADPALMRRLVADGWLRSNVPAARSAAALEKAVGDALSLVTSRVLEGDGVRIELLENAVGDSVRVWRTTENVRYVLTPPDPSYGRKVDGIELVVECPVDVDLTSAAPAWQRVRLVRDGVTLASCDAEGAFECDAARWRTAFPSPSWGDTDRDMLPPHVPLMSPEGRLIALLTPHGRLEAFDASADDRDAEAERFLAQAASTLPTAEYLDLLGEYLFAYVFDSPDPRLPGLVGSEAVHGEIHQTVFETLSTAAGGRCRGDCDDLAELYQAIARRQGKLAHIINIPAHNATAWAEKDDTAWLVHVLHTGPPLEFRGADLPEALRAAYGHFGFLESFDPERLGVSIRFAGENTRSSWLLGWRIFSDPAYSEAMVDVQRDWHFHTYHRAIVKMEAMLEAGDEDSANFRELSGLFERTGQWTRAVEYIRKARKGSDDASLALRISELSALHQAKDHAAFKALARKIVDEELPSRAESPGYFNIVLDLVGIMMLEDEEVGFAAETLRKSIGRRVSMQVTGLGLELQEADTELLQTPGLGELLQFLRVYAFVATELLAKVEEEGGSWDEHGLGQTLADIETWLRTVAMQAADTDLERISVYALVGILYESVLGREELDRRVDAAEFPDADIDHTKRLTTVLQMKRDMPWLKASPAYWSGRMSDLVEDEETPAEPEELRRLARLTVEARKALEAIGMAVDPQNMTVHLTELMAALMTEDEALLRRRLRHAAVLRDKRVYDATADNVGRLAKHLDATWFRRVMSIWSEELDHKPSFFSIAWAAAREDAPAHAVIAGEAGVAAFPEDEAFAEELGFMKELFKGDAASSE